MATWLIFGMLVPAGAGDAFDPFDPRETGDAEPVDLSEVDRPAGIVNGNVALPGEYPNVVALAMDAPGGLATFCSGSLIHPTWVLTAAHCIQGLPDSPVFVLFGEDVNGGNQQRLVETVQRIPYPGYDAAQFRHDLGLFELAEPVEDVDVMLLNPEPLTDAWIGRVLLFAGFGITSDGGVDAGVKRYAEIPIASYDGDNIAASDPERNVCNGDSGGPSMQFVERGWAQQVGINAYVTPGCVNGDSGSTDVSSYLDWIEENVPEVRYEPPPPLEDAGPGAVGSPLDFGANDAKNGPGFGLRFGEKRRGYGPRPAACAGVPARGGVWPWAWLAVAAIASTRRRALTTRAGIGRGSPPEARRSR